MATDVEAPARRRIGRRAWLGGIGIGVAGVGAGLIYNAAPFFWKQYARDLGSSLAPAPKHPNPAHWPDRGIHAAWLGHSTVLMKIDGFTILTDPVFSTWVGLGLGPFTLGLKRIVEPALEVEQLPKVDLILLSHAHMDHFDLPSLRALEAGRPEVVTAHATSDLLRVNNYKRVQEAAWNQKLRVGPASIEAFEVRHWGARMRRDTYRGYNAYTIRVGRYRVVFGGDTAITDTFRQVGGAHLAIMPVGAYNPWIRVHCNPEQAWQMANDARADMVLPVHHRTFHLSQEAAPEPLERILTAAGSAVDDRIPARVIGDELRIV